MTTIDTDIHRVDGPMTLPFHLRVTAHMDTIAARIETPDDITLHVRYGENVYDIIPAVLRRLPNPEATVWINGYGIYVPISAFRTNPLRYLTAWHRSLIATPDIVPAVLK